MKEHYKTIPSVDDVRDIIVESLEDNKAEDVVVINLAGKSDMADYMVIASGRSDRHVCAVADHLSKKLKDHAVPRFNIEGMKDGNWVLVDTLDIVIHIFRSEVREFYGLEKMWGVEVPAEEFVTA